MTEKRTRGLCVPCTGSGGQLALIVQQPVDPVHDVGVEARDVAPGDGVDVVVQLRHVHGVREGRVGDVQPAETAPQTGRLVNGLGGRAVRTVQRQQATERSSVVVECDGRELKVPTGH